MAYFELRIALNLIAYRKLSFLILRIIATKLSFQVLICVASQVHSNLPMIPRAVRKGIVS